MGGAEIDEGPCFRERISTQAIIDDDDTVIDPTVRLSLLYGGQSGDVGHDLSVGGVLLAALFTVAGIVACPYYRYWR